MLLAAFAQALDRSPSPIGHSEPSKLIGTGDSASSLLDKENRILESEIGLVSETAVSNHDSLAELETTVRARGVPRGDSIRRTLPLLQDGVASMQEPDPDSVREYWWIPLKRETKIRRNQKLDDSIFPRKTPQRIDLVGIRVIDGWYRLRLGIVNARGPRLWRLNATGGILREVNNSMVDSVRVREMKSGIELGLREERIVRGPGSVSFYFGLGPRVQWEFGEVATDSSRMRSVQEKHTVSVPAHYENGQYVAGYEKSKYEVERISRRGLRAGFLFGMGARLHSESGMALAGGVEFGPEWKRIRYLGNLGSQREWLLLEPKWSVGVDWFF